jgi:multicomponent Na+:H+ antiporter subunit D
MQTFATPAYNWLIVAPVLLPLLGAALLQMFGRRDSWRFALTALVVLATGLADLLLLVRVMGTGPVSMTMGRWLPPFGISFTADATGAGFALVASIVVLAVLIYAQDPVHRVAVKQFPALVLVLLAGVGGSFLTGDLFNLYVWFEVMLIASFGLMVSVATPPALDAAIKYGLLNFIGTSLFLLALGLIYGAMGTLNMADLVAAGTLPPPAVTTSIGALLLVAFGLKSAAIPVNGWLPASYHRPPVVVSALLGGLLTKVGVYALLRTLLLILPATRDSLEPVLAVVAGVTLLLAPLGALAENNLRRAIGYMLIGGIGATLVGLALPTDIVVSGAAIYVVHAMLTITALYLVAGLIETVSGETEIDKMGGLYATNAMLSVLFLVLVAAIAGVPPFLGFWPKLLLLWGASDIVAHGPGMAAPALAVCLLVNALLTVIAAARIWARIFWRDAPGAKLKPASAAPQRLATVTATLLTILVVGLGLWPEPLLRFGASAAAGLLHSAAYVQAVGLAVRP